MIKIFLVLVIVFIFPFITPTNASVTDYRVETLSQCSSPTVSLAIKEINSQNSYNTSTLSAPVNSCVKITLVNADFNEHTFTIENITYFNVYAASGSSSSDTLITPNTNVTLNFFCAVPGHESTEHGIFIVGTGNQTTSSTPSSTSSTSSTSSSSTAKSSPGFEASAFFAMFGIIGVVVLVRRKYGNK